jgi:hypothetical protein
MHAGCSLIRNGRVLLARRIAPPFETFRHATFYGPESSYCPESSDSIVAQRISVLKACGPRRKVGRRGRRQCAAASWPWGSPIPALCG